MFKLHFCNQADNLYCHMMTFHFHLGGLPELGVLQYKTIQETCHWLNLTVLVKVLFNENLSSVRLILSDETIRRCNNGLKLTRMCRSHKYTCSPPWKPPWTSPSPQPPTPSCLSPCSTLDWVCSQLVLKSESSPRLLGLPDDFHFWG